MTYYYKYLISLLVTVSAYAAPENLLEQKKAAPGIRQVKGLGTPNDLKTSSSSYSHQYSSWGGNSPGGYELAITGVGTRDRSDYYDPSYNTLGGYDSSIKNTGYGDSGYGATGYGDLGSAGYIGGRGPYSGYNQNGYGATGYGGLGSAGYIGGREPYSGYNQNGYGATGFSPSGYGTSGFGANGLDGTGGYYDSGHGGGNGGYGGYGGYGGNGGLASYYGYNNPSYQGAGHLGYGYYNKKPGYGNIYSSSITPSLVTGYRGYTRR